MAENGFNSEAKLDLKESVRNFYDRRHRLGVASLGEYFVTQRDVFIGAIVGAVALGALTTYIVNSETISTANEIHSVAAQVEVRSPEASAISVNTANNTVTFIAEQGGQLKYCKAAYITTNGRVPIVDGPKCDTFIRVP